MSQTSPESGLQLLLILLLGGCIILLVLGALLAVMWAQRKRWIRSERPKTPESSTSDPWEESARRVPYDPTAPRERNPDDDLPSLGGPRR